ncbi:YokU family protein [Bacillus massiliigorillae]|uniref:YokU family protein n=1 Tax=Bacillus massiliigorillae TaxID=1243664 RepID=UPI0003999D40|nr:YokU family protein [Bacillus massiliigorillae]
MNEVCVWCEQETARKIEASVYWELPDGTKAIEITDVPSYYCDNCQATYQTDERVREIENQLFIINTKNIESVLSFEELMNKPRLLKRNYFDFDY